MVNESGKSQDGKTLHLTFIRDVPYASQSDAQKLDIYTLSAPPEPCPVIVWMHPGGFQYGDKAGSAPTVTATMDMFKFFQPALERGYAAVSINYRLSHEAVFPALVHDAKAAVRWVKANAAEYNFNPDKVAAWGSSSGGYMAAMLATTDGIAGMEDLSMGNPDFSSRVNVAADWYGPVDFSTMDAQHRQLGREANVYQADSPESKFMGAPIDTITEKCKTASPMTYVGRGNAPIYILQGTGDPVIPYFQSVELAEKMAAANGRENVVLDLVKDAGHADPVFFTDENINKTLDFLDRYMK